jgi:predicted Zn-dependent protease
MNRAPKLWQPLLAIIVAAGLIGLPVSAHPQQTQQTQQTPPQQTQTQGTQAQPDASQQGQTPASPDASQQTSADQNTADPPDQQIHPKNPKDDVNKIGDRGVGKGINFYSLEREVALGKQLAQEVEKSAKFVDDPIIGDYINRVGQNLVRNSDARVPFTIKVLDDDSINAFALPGGFFYVQSGLILAADEESELAGVMAHEIAHVCARHGTRTATKGELAQIAMIPAMIFIPYTWTGYALFEGLQFAIPLGFLKFSRDQEREADFLGLQYMYKAGYDPNSYVSFFEKIQAEERRRPGSIPKVFSTHPPTAERIHNIQDEISRILPARNEYVVTTSEFDVVKARLRMIQNRSKLNDSGTNKPTLRKRTEQTQKTGGQDGSSSGDDDRPTLKRRTDDPPQR